MNQISSVIWMNIFIKMRSKFRLYLIIVLSLFSLSGNLLGQNVEFWLQPDGIVSADGEYVDSWGSSETIVQAFQDDVDLKPELVENMFNGLAGVTFDGSQFLNLPSDLNFIGGNKTICILFNPGTPAYYSLLSRGRAASGDRQDGDFSIVPLGANFRFRWAEGSNQLSLDIPNLQTDQFYFLRFELDRELGDATLFVNEVEIQNSEVAMNYTAPSTDRPTFIGAYPGASINFVGSLLEIGVFKGVFYDSALDSLLIQIGQKYLPAIDLGDDILLSSNESCSFELDAGSGFSSYQWSTGEETQVIAVTEPGTYSVVARGDLGLLTSDTINIGFGESLIDEEQLLCSYDSLLWNLNLDDGFTLTWSDGLISNESSRYLHPGEAYSVEISNGFCSIQTAVVDVESDNYADQVQLNDFNLFCQGNELFLESGAESAVSYTWSTDEETASIVPEADGTYWVKAVNENGCEGRDTVELVMAGVAPTAEFEVGAICEGNPVNFEDVTSPDFGNTAARAWNIQSENESESEEFSGDEIIYQAGEPGDLYVSLLVTLDNGCTGLVRDTLTVSPLPLVGFNYDEVIACRGNEVAYESQTGVPGDGGIAQYSWEFGNGELDFGIVGSTVFDDMGVNTVKHIVRTTAGCVDSLEADIVVLGSPVVDFGFDTVCVGTPTGFYEAVDVSESGPVFYQWSFGDGFTSNFPNTSHEYTDAGTYQVTLTATGNNFGNAGCMDMATQTVYVFESPSAEITTVDGCLNEGGVLVDDTEWTSVGGQKDPIANREWSVVSGGGSAAIGTDSVVFYLPEVPGNYDVLFAFETEAGCTGETNGSVEVLALPISNFEASWPFVDPPVELKLTNESEEASAYSWLVDGEEVSTAFEPTIVLSEIGEYVIELVVSNSLGCADTSSQVATIIIPEYDIAIVDIYYNRVGSRLELSALIGNNGNVPISSFDMEVQIGRDINYRESVETLIPAGELIEYSLDADFQYVPGRVLPYTCITLENPNGVGDDETDLTNNEVCIGLDREKATFIPPYPNPAGDVVNLGFVMPREGVVEVEMVSSEGRVVYSRAISLLEGYEVVEVDLKRFRKGMYYLRYEYEVVQEVFKVVVK